MSESRYPFAFFPIRLFYHFFFMLEQRYCIKFLHSQGYPGNEIFEQLKNMYGDKSLCKAQVYFWIAELKRGRTDLSDDPHPGRPRNTYIDDQIRAVIKVNPYASCREIGTMVGSCGATVFRRLTELGYKSLLLKWVPHHLDNSQKKLRVQMSRKMKQILTMLKHDNFKYVFTGDETWCKYHFDHKRKWVLSSEDLDERIKPSNYERKIMIIIFFGINGLVLLKFKPENEHFNSEFFINNILKQLEINTDASGAKKKKKLVYLHFDNAPSHSSNLVNQYLTSSPFTLLPHPPYSPDLSPCDFAINGALKTSLEGCSFVSEDELLSAIENFFTQKPSQYYENIFNGWIRRCQQCIDAHGDYFE